MKEESPRTAVHFVNICPLPALRHLPQVERLLFTEIIRCGHQQRSTAIGSRITCLTCPHDVAAPLQPIVIPTSASVTALHLRPHAERWAPTKGSNGHPVIPPSSRIDNASYRWSIFPALVPTFSASSATWRLDWLHEAPTANAPYREPSSHRRGLSNQLSNGTRADWNVLSHSAPTRHLQSLQWPCLPPAGPLLTFKQQGIRPDFYPSRRAFIPFDWMTSALSD